MNYWYGTMENWINSNAFIEFANDTKYVRSIIDDYNPHKRKVLIVFDDMIADIFNNNKPEPILTKLNISLVSIKQS